MLDREGYRPNVGIILVNRANQVFWGKRIRSFSWQFPQGGIRHGENPKQAMYRELYEEIGLRARHVKILGRTRNWLRYDVPDSYLNHDVRGFYKGQKQIWFLVRLLSTDKNISLCTTKHPEFDAWQWQSYQVPLEDVIEFKHEVYTAALDELAPILTRQTAYATRDARKHKLRGKSFSKGNTANG